MREWRDVEPAEAAGMTIEQLREVDRPYNEVGVRCPFPWDPQQLVGAPLGQYHCPYCLGMEVAGLPHSDVRDLSDTDRGMMGVPPESEWIDGLDRANDS